MSEHRLTAARAKKNCFDFILCYACVYHVGGISPNAKMTMGLECVSGGARGGGEASYGHENHDAFMGMLARHCRVHMLACQRLTGQMPQI